MPVKKIIYDGIKFDSALECNCYKALMVEGITFDHHIKHEIFPGFISSITSFDKDERKGKDMYLSAEKFGSLSYSPDFQAKNCSWFIETKGFLRPEAAMRIKLFKMKLTREGSVAYYFMPRNKKHIDQTIEIIKTL